MSVFLFLNIRIVKYRYRTTSIPNPSQNAHDDRINGPRKSRDYYFFFYQINFVHIFVISVVLLWYGTGTVLLPYNRHLIKFLPSIFCYFLPHIIFRVYSRVIYFEEWFLINYASILQVFKPII